MSISFNFDFAIEKWSRFREAVEGLDELSAFPKVGACVVDLLEVFHTSLGPLGESYKNSFTCLDGWKAVAELPGTVTDALEVFQKIIFGKFSSETLTRLMESGCNLFNTGYEVVDFLGLSSDFIKQYAQINFLFLFFGSGNRTLGSCTKQSSTVYDILKNGGDFVFAGAKLLGADKVATVASSISAFSKAGKYLFV